jgi:hypothetical protein
MLILGIIKDVDLAICLKITAIRLNRIHGRTSSCRTETLILVRTEKKNANDGKNK